MSTTGPDASTARHASSAGPVGTNRGAEDVTYLMTNTPETSGDAKTLPDTFRCYACGKDFPAVKPGSGRLRFANWTEWDIEGKPKKHCRECSGDVWTAYLDGVPKGAKVTLYLTDHGSKAGSWAGEYSRPMSTDRTFYTAKGSRWTHFGFMPTSSDCCTFTKTNGDPA